MSFSLSHGFLLRYSTYEDLRVLKGIGIIAKDGMAAHDIYAEQFYCFLAEKTIAFSGST